MGARGRRWIIAVGVVPLLAAACGTRLPDSAFSSGSVVAGTGGGGGVGTGLGGTSATTGPSTAATAGGGASSGTGTSGNAVLGGTSGTATTGSTQQGAATGPAPVTGGVANFASDVGVTPTSITIGNITSKENPFGPQQFIPNFIGAQAYFDDLNAHGGINGRKVNFILCDDQGDPNQNVACAQTLIQTDHIFAMVANNIYEYGGASYVNSAKVPDIGGEPIDNSYYKYPYLFDIIAEQYPRTGAYYGQNGQLWGTSEEYAFFRQHYGVNKIGVVYYDQVSSERGAQVTELGAKNIGDQVVMEPVNLALPDYSGAVNDMRSQGVQAVFNELDEAGGAKLCQAMDDNGWTPTAFVGTSAIWNNTVGTEFANSPKCRNITFVNAPELSFNDTFNPTVAQFRADMATYESQAMPTNQLAIWAEEGYAAAMWFTAAARSCGADLTRACVVHYMNTATFTAGGMLYPRTFHVHPFTTSGSQRTCTDVVEWQDSAGGWVERANVNNTGCYTTHYYSYPAE